MILKIARRAGVGLVLALSLGLGPGAARAAFTIPETILSRCLAHVLNRIYPRPPADPNLLPAPEVLGVYRTMLIPEVERTPSEMASLMKYKNEHQEAPRELNLLGADLHLRSAHMQALLQTLKESKRIRYEGSAELYRLQVMHLRKGDTIRAQGRRAVLGDFLGAGNLTHIYADAEHPELVIRIPFNIWHGAPWSSRRYMQEYVEMEPNLDKAIPRVRIHTVAEGFAWVTADRVRSNLDGRTFARMRPPAPSAEWLAREARLKELVWLHHRFRFAEGVWIQMARQFLWDEGRGVWIMIDWEEPASS
jgi:hypothetical protein